MNRTRIAASAVAVLALLTACGGSGSSSTPAATSAASTPSTSTSASDAATPTPDDSSSPAVNPSGLAGSLAALQLCGTTLGYAAGAIAGVPADQLSKLEDGVASAQSKTGAAEAELLASSKDVVAAVKAGDQQAITDTAQKLGDLCGAGG